MYLRSHDFNLPFLLHDPPVHLGQKILLLCDKCFKPSSNELTFLLLLSHLFELFRAPRDYVLQPISRTLGVQFGQITDAPHRAQCGVVFGMRALGSQGSDHRETLSPRRGRQEPGA